MSEHTRIALVTGANRGLGRAGALALAAQGTDLILTYRAHEEEAREVVGKAEALGVTARALRLDTADVETFDAFADDVRRLLADVWGRDHFDFLVNNAGHAHAGSIADTSLDAFQGLFDVHVRGVFFLTQRLLPLLADGGRVVNLSTGLTRFTRPGLSAYAMAKGAVEVFTRYLAAELGERGIAVNTLAPGPVGTDFGGGYLRDDPEVRAQLGGVAALGRVGEPDDIGGALAALLAEGTGWITAQRVEASGGTLI